MPDVLLAASFCNICLVQYLTMSSWSQRAIGLGGLKTSKLHVLKNVSGVLTPVSPRSMACHLTSFKLLATSIFDAACVMLQQ